MGIDMRQVQSPDISPAPDIQGLVVVFDKEYFRHNLIVFKGLGDHDSKAVAGLVVCLYPADREIIYGNILRSAKERVKG